MMSAEPQKEHKWLQQLLGEWTFEGKMSGKDGTPIKNVGREHVRPLGKLWVVAEGEAQMTGGDTGKMIMTLGFNPQTKRYAGTWIGSMMTHLWIYDGQMDASERVLTLSAEGPSMAGDGTARYEDIIEIVSNDHRLLRTRVLMDGGEWKEFMRVDYRRKS